MLELFDSLTRQKQAVRPLNDNEVRLYTCGPTVYDFAHVGNFRTYVAQDVLHRYLLFKGFRVRRVMNLTDVDDKTIRGSREAGVPLREFTQRFEAAFFEDADALNLMRADVYPKATETIPEMIALVQTLLNKGAAYLGDDGSVYFSIAKFPDYGKLSHLDREGLQAGARVQQQEYTKEQACDFVLWKAWDAADGDVYWDAPFGRGRPGWHLECSAMSEKYLGTPFDIHSGGVDLRFPHHENEIAQSEAATGREFCRLWVHCEHLMVNGQKMSKSLHNFYTLRDLFAKSFKPGAVRYLLLSAHYRQPLNLTFEALENAERTLERYLEFAAHLQAHASSVAPNNTEVAALASQALRDFSSAMDNDLNASLALAAVFELIRQTNKLIDEGKFGSQNAAEVRDALEKMDSVLGLLHYQKEKTLPLPREELDALLRQRADARSRGFYAESDRIREQLRKKGIAVQDTPKGQEWRVV